MKLTHWTTDGLCLRALMLTCTNSHTHTCIQTQTECNTFIQCFNMEANLKKIKKKNNTSCDSLEI